MGRLFAKRENIMALTLTELLAQQHSYALLSRTPGSIEVLQGTLEDVATIAEIPLNTADGRPQEVLSLVPYRQVTERGFECIDDGAPLRCLVVTDRSTVTTQAFLDAHAQTETPTTIEGGAFDQSDEQYAETVRRVITDEIGSGQGANFVIRRDYVGTVKGGDFAAARNAFASLITQERGAYWTFMIVTPDLLAVGASPEAHVTVHDGTVTMNPISGTLRHGTSGPTAQALTAFLDNTKETEELFMVVDEELKMMAEVCSSGGQVTGPSLKRMSQLTHTEYRLRGTSSLDPRDIVRATMFAPTVTGSPMQNACSIIAKHEARPRGYYSGIAALFTPAAGGSGHDLDAPILIRTAYFADGTVRVPVGATLVRHSDPAGEVSETHGKAAGVLRALGVLGDAGRRAAGTPEHHGQAHDDHEPRLSTADEQALLHARNERLTPFWLNPQSVAPNAPYVGMTAVVVDAEDRFTTMLAHQLRHLGFTVTVVPWSDVSTGSLGADLVVAGPGPGDPLDVTDPRIARMHAIIAARVEAGLPLLAVCLSHQILAHLNGFALARLPEPRQGVQLTVDLFGKPATIGFYNTFTARIAAGGVPLGGPEVASDPATGDVHALRGPGFASVQGHLESILSRDGIESLGRLVHSALRE